MDKIEMNDVELAQAIEGAREWCDHALGLRNQKRLELKGAEERVTDAYDRLAELVALRQQRNG